MSYCPLTDEDMAQLRRMPAGVRASYAIGSISDEVVTRSEIRSERAVYDPERAFRASHGLDDMTRGNLAQWSIARRRARRAAAELAEAEGALA